MAVFGKALFGGSRFIFWSLAPAILLFLIVLPLLVTKWNPVTELLVAALWVTGICLILGMLSPARFGWSFRVVCAMVFLCYAAYALFALAGSGWKLKKPLSRSEANPVNALIGLVTIGGPALMYAALGRFTLLKETQGDGDEEWDELIDDDDHSEVRT